MKGRKLTIGFYGPLSTLRGLGSAWEKMRLKNRLDLRKITERGVRINGHYHELGQLKGSLMPLEK